MFWIVRPVAQLVDLLRLVVGAHDRGLEHGGSDSAVTVTLLGHAGDAQGGVDGGRGAQRDRDVALDGAEAGEGEGDLVHAAGQAAEDVARRWRRSWSVRSPCRAGEVSVTVTPGSAAPSVELTLPLRVEVWVPWAPAVAARPGTTTRASASTEARARPCEPQTHWDLLSSESLSDRRLTARRLPQGCQCSRQMVNYSGRIGISEFDLDRVTNSVPALPRLDHPAVLHHEDDVLQGGRGRRGGCRARR